MSIEISVHTMKLLVIFCIGTGLIQLPTIYFFYAYWIASVKDGRREITCGEFQAVLGIVLSVVVAVSSFVVAMMLVPVISE